MLQVVKAEKPGSPIQTQWGLRESLLQDILSAIADAREAEHFGLGLDIALRANADLRIKILGNQTDKLIARKYILGDLPEEAKPIVGQFITDTLRERNA